MPVSSYHTMKFTTEQLEIMSGLLKCLNNPNTKIRRMGVDIDAFSEHRATLENIEGLIGLALDRPDFIF